MFDLVRELVDKQGAVDYYIMFIACHKQHLQNDLSLCCACFYFISNKCKSWHFKFVTKVGVHGFPKSNRTSQIRL